MTVSSPQCNSTEDSEEIFEDERHIELIGIRNDSDNSVTDSDHYITPPIIRSAVRHDQLREPALDDLSPVRPEDYGIVQYLER